MIKRTTQLLMLLFTVGLSAQVGINNVNPQSSLDITASNVATPANNDGILIPRIDAFPGTNPTATQQSMIVYLTADLTGVNVSGTAENYDLGFYYWDNTVPNWIALGGGKDAWLLEGNGGTTSGTDFLGTTDNQALAIKINSTANAATDFRFTDKNQLEFLNNDRTVFIGEGAGASWVHSGAVSTRRHTLIGHDSGALLTSGFANVGVGANTLAATVSTSWNTAVGTNVLQGNTGGFNTGVGGNSLSGAVSGSGNAGFGYNSLRLNTSGSSNTAIGRDTMDKNLSGSFNVAVGTRAMVNGIATSNNVAVGESALAVNINGNSNTAIGKESISDADPGSLNVGLGYRSLSKLSAGVLLAAPGITNSSNNVGIGAEAGYNELGERNVFIGHRSGYGQTNTGVFQTARFGSVFIGSNSGEDEYEDNKLYIENTDSPTPLLYGDFDTDILRVGGQLQIGSADDATAGSIYRFPIVDGTVGQALRTDGSGNVAWGNVTSTNWSILGNTGTNASTNFLGTTDGEALTFRTGNTERFRVANANQVHALDFGSQALPFYSFGGDTNSGIWLTQADELAIGAGNLEFIRLRERGQDELVLNLPGLNIDFRVESDQFDDLIFGDASTNQVSIGNKAPAFGIDTFQSYAYFVGDHAVNGYSTSGVGVYGADSTDGIGLEGVSTSAGVGVAGASNATGIVSFFAGAGGTFQGDLLGVLAISNNVNTPGVFASAGGAPLFSFGANEGVVGNGSFSGVTGFGDGANSIGVLGVQAAGGLAAVFASGDLTASGVKAFTIDHPTDPENKLLKHFSIESNEVLNVYRGTTVFNATGEAVIDLPDYFASINVNYSYQLTAVGAAMPNIYVAEEVTNNKFKVAGGLSGKKVSWTVFANRNDKYVQENPDRIKNEVEKTGDLKGKYLDHKSWNQPESKAYFKVKLNEVTKSKRKKDIKKSNVHTSFNNGPDQDVDED